jgi:flagellar biosynthesis component FlhA
MVVVILTGHAPVRGHLYTMGLFDGDPTCRFCRNLGLYNKPKAEVHPEENEEEEEKKKKEKKKTEEKKKKKKKKKEKKKKEEEEEKKKKKCLIICVKHRPSMR